MKRMSARLFPMGLTALAAVAGCSDDPRIPDGERFSQRVVGTPGVVLIDDMEDGTQYILSDDRRVGLWYTYNDASVNGVQEPAIGFPMYRILDEDGDAVAGAQIPPRTCGGDATTPFFAGEDSCKFVARTWGTGQRGWGAGMGADINGEGGQKNPFDASEYGGIGFFAYANAARNGQLRVNVQDVRTTPESADAADRRGIIRCESYDETGTETGACNDHYGRTITVGATWTWYEIPWSCMAGQNFGYPSNTGELSPLTSALVGVQFQIQGADPADTGMPTLAVEDFDFAIDNLSFLEAGRVPAGPCPLTQ